MLKLSKNRIMKRFFTTAFVTVIISLSSLFAQSNFHDFTVKDIDGNEFAMSQFKGKKVMLVNVASKCGLTPQYEALEKLYKEYKSKDFVIVAFPANNFLKQEPGTDAEIKEFCSVNFGVTFPMMSKISVKGDNIHALYQWATQKEKNGLIDSKVKWNFQKYLIDEKGKLVKQLDPGTKPYDAEIVNWIKS